MQNSLRRVLLCSIILILLLDSLVYAQRLNFRQIGRAEGLQQEQVTAVFQDSSGYIWVGTFSGVSRYNGYKFENMFNEEGQITNALNSIAEDSLGRLYFGSAFSGLFVFDGTNLSRISLGEGKSINSVYAITKDEKGVIYLGTAGGIVRLNGLVPELVLPKSTVEFSSITSLLIESGNVIWAGTTEGLFRIEGNRAERLPFKDQGKDKDLDVTAIVRGSNEVLWAGTNAGLFRVENGSLIKKDVPGLYSHSKITCGVATGSDGAVYFGTDFGAIRISDVRSKLYTTVNGLNSNSIRSLLIDDENSIWFGTDNGISLMRSFSFVHYNQETGLSGSEVNDIFEDSKGRLMLAGGKFGVTIIDGGKTSHLTEEEGLLSPVVYALGEVGNGKIILGTKTNISTWDGEKAEIVVDEVNVTSSFTDSKKRVWMPTLQGIYLLENDVISQPLQGFLSGKASIYCVNEDLQGRIWFCTREQGCLIFDGEKLISLGEEQGLTEESVWAVDFDAEGRAWIGTNGGGVFVYDGENMVNYNSRNSLLDNYVWQVLVDRNGNVWLGTNKGLTRFAGKKFTLFTEDDGLATNEGAVNCCLEDSRGNLWFGSAKGISRWTHENNSIRFVPHLTIEKVSVEGSGIDPKGKGDFRHDENGITFEFSALSFHNPSEIEYRYSLKGADEHWDILESYRPVVYSKLPPGNYEFKVKAGYLNGWSKTASYAFIIHRPFFTTWWFYLICISASIGIFFLVMYLRTRKIEREKEVLNLLVEERAKELISANKELKTFNTAVSNNLLVPLRHITGYCDLIKKESGDKLDDLTRNYLDRITVSVARQKDITNNLLQLSIAGSREIKHTNVNISRLFNDLWRRNVRNYPGLEVEFAVEEEVFIWADVVLMEMVLEVVLSNSFKAVRETEKPEIKLRSSSCDEGAVVSISDNGIGFHSDLSEKLFQPFSLIHRKEDFEGSGLGLNVAQRIIHRHGGKIWAQGLAGEGATLSFSIPDKEKKQK